MSNPKDTYAETRGWKSILKRQFFKRTIFCRWVMNLALFYFLTTVFFFILVRLRDWLLFSCTTLDCQGVGVGT